MACGKSSSIILKNAFFVICYDTRGPQTAENVAEQFNINRVDQDQFALNSQQRTAAAQAQGFFPK